jgi:hypothetical protein
VVDLRGQSVPHARIRLADGTLYDADENGWLRLELPPGVVDIAEVDGAAQGHVNPPPVSIALGQETAIAWTLLPLQDLVDNGGFDTNLRGWEVSSPADTHRRVLADNSEHPAVLEISGGRRPWGGPFAAVEINVPQGLTAGVLSFQYRMLDSQQALRVRVVVEAEQTLLWHTAMSTADFHRVWLDMTPYAGRSVTLRFELWGAKNSPPGRVLIDDVILGNVPLLDDSAP